MTTTLQSLGGWSSRRTLRVVLAAGLWCAGCGLAPLPDGSSEEEVQPHDAGGDELDPVAHDAGGVEDGGAEADAGGVDDAGTSDAGRGAEAGRSTDAGSDGGVGLDAGLTPDAGVSVDAGSEANPRALRVTPPNLTSPTILYVGGDYHSVDGSVAANRVIYSTYVANGLRLPDSTTFDFGGKDVVIVADGPVYAGLHFTNFRNLVAIGLEIDIHKPWVNPAGWTSGTMPSGNSDAAYVNFPRNCVQLSNWTGVAYFEGVYFHGVYAIDDFKVAGPQGRLVVQGFRLEAVNHAQPGSGPNWTSPAGGFHNDCLQSYSGLGQLDLDWGTMIAGYQGIMWRSGGSASGGANWGPTRMSRLNIASAHRRGLNTGDNPRSGHYSGAVNIIPFDYALATPCAGCAQNAPDIPANIKGPYLLDDLWLEYDTVYASLQVAMGYGTASPGTYQGQIVGDAETGRSKLWFPKWPAYGTPNGDPSNQLFPPATRFGRARDPGQYFREGPPQPTLAHPENPAGDYAPPAAVGSHWPRAPKWDLRLNAPSSGHPGYAP